MDLTDIVVSKALANGAINEQKGVAGGIAELNSSGKVPETQLPSYVDDVVEYSSLSEFPATGESGKIYVATDTNKSYRWTGTQYVQIGGGTTDSALSTTSENPVQNKVITNAIAPVIGAPSDPSATTFNFLFDKPSVELTEKDYLLETFQVNGGTPTFVQYKFTFSSAAEKTVFASNVYGMTNSGTARHYNSAKFFILDWNGTSVTCTGTYYSYNLAGTMTTGDCTPSGQNFMFAQTGLVGIDLGSSINYFVTLNNTVQPIASGTTFWAYTGISSNTRTAGSNSGSYNFTFNGSSLSPWETIQNKVATLESGKQDKLTAGTNITITNNIISASASGDADWTATSGQSGFIANKPFDVTTGGTPTKVIEESIVYDDEEGNFYTTTGTTIFTSSDVGKSITINYGDSTISGTITHIEMGEVEGYGYTINYPLESTYPSILIVSVTDDTETFVIIADGETHTSADVLDVEVYVTSSTTTKLSATKLNIGSGLSADGDTLIATAQSDLFVVNITADEEEGELVYSSDKTFSEITSAYSEGKDIVAKLDLDTGEVTILQLIEVSRDDEGFYSIEFSGVATALNSYFIIDMDSANAVTVTANLLVESSTVTAITQKIPDAASSTNQLTDKAYVDAQVTSAKTTFTVSGEMLTIS